MTRIRESTLDDLALVLRHRRGMFRDMGHGESVLDAMEAASASFFSAALRDGTYRGFFAVDEEGRVLAGGGIVLLAHQPQPVDPRPRRPFVVNMFTEPEHRRRGLARLLMQAMIDWTRAQGYATLTLHASDAGRALYESMGFVPTNEMRLRLTEPIPARVVSSTP
jgi:GNAT superfamily N-acetyltransferase